MLKVRGLVWAAVASASPAALGIEANHPTKESAERDAPCPKARRHSNNQGANKSEAAFRAEYGTPSGPGAPSRERSKHSPMSSGMGAHEKSGTPGWSRMAAITLARLGFVVGSCRGKPADVAQQGFQRHFSKVRVDMFMQAFIFTQCLGNGAGVARARAAQQRNGR